jgi:hypothetical protein
LLGAASVAWAGASTEVRTQAQAQAHWVAAPEAGQQVAAGTGITLAFTADGDVVDPPRMFQVSARLQF